MRKHKIAKNEKEAWDLQEMHKNKPHGWVQWKGTDVCMDVRCKCGYIGHIDVDSAYFIECAKCGTVYMANGHIELIELIEKPDNCVVITDNYDD